MDSEVAAHRRIGSVKDLLVMYSRQDKCMKFSRNHERGEDEIEKKKTTTGKMRGDEEGRMRGNQKPGRSVTSHIPS
jgi:hypothetical protein